MKKKINFFTPTFNLTGSEIALFNLLSIEDNFDKTVVSKLKGTLSDQLPLSSKFISRVSSNESKVASKSLFKRFIIKTKSFWYSENKFLKKINKQAPADLWYVNTITLPGVISYAKKNSIPVILHSHELQHMYAPLTDQQINELVEYPVLIITSSKSCKNVLMEYGRKDNIEICYPAINFDKIKIDDSKAKEIRKRNKIDNDIYLWTMAGTMDANKNPLLFVEIAKQFAQKTDKVKFMWISGSGEDNSYFKLCKNKANELGISDKIIWVLKPDEEYYNYLNAADGFVLTSKKESFSMVTAEALFLAKPVVSFDCGGVKEIVIPDTGIIVNDYNINDIIAAMWKVMNKEFIFNPSKAKLSVERFDMHVQKKIWVGLIDKVI